MARLLITSAVGILAVSLLAACGTMNPSPDVPPAAAPRGSAGSPVAASPVASPTRGTPAATPTASGSRPTVDVAHDPMAQRALADTRRLVKIKSGVPAVVLSQPVTPQELRDWGLGDWNFTPGCVPPLYLVIIKGDFDWDDAFPAPVAPGTEMPVRYIAYVYDLIVGGIRAMYGDPDGGQVKKALGDPTLPDVDPASLPNPKFPAQVPCSPTVLPGVPMPSPARP
ncbi:MAG TPA: hypothetical protein VFW96_20845 [Thermomicrobiales bacterium]|nr:hypothetical protein [Thermomicrobiales bacterium]